MPLLTSPGSQSEPCKESPFLSLSMSFVTLQDMAVGSSWPGPSAILLMVSRLWPDCLVFSRELEKERPNRFSLAPN